MLNLSTYFRTSQMNKSPFDKGGIQGGFFTAINIKCDINPSESPLMKGRLKYLAELR